jgi:uncharacterized protein YndB with AHSA1/START domain
MGVTTDPAAAEATIVMSRVYDAPRDMVWEAITEPKHVARWWGGPHVTNPVCEMDVRPGGRWRHIMRFSDGREMHLNFVFLEVDKPKRLVWQPVQDGQRTKGIPTSFTVTLSEIGDRTEWRMVARFDSPGARDAAVAMGFTKPIAASTERLIEYLKTM